MYLEGVAPGPPPVIVLLCACLCAVSETVSLHHYGAAYVHQLLLGGLALWASRCISAGSLRERCRNSELLEATTLFAAFYMCWVGMQQLTVVQQGAHFARCVSL